MKQLLANHLSMSLTLLQLSLTVSLPGEGQQICRMPTSASSMQLSELATLVAANDSVWALNRAELGLTAMDSSVMTVIQSDSLCARVDSAVMLTGRPRVFENLVVVSLNNGRFGAFAPRSSARVFVVDGNFSVLTVLSADMYNFTTTPPDLPPDDPGGPPISRSGWSFSASSTWSAINIADAADGNTSSRWTSGAAVQPGSTFFSVDLQSPTLIGSVRVDDSQFTADLPLAGQVLVSTNGSTFSQAAQWTSGDVSNGILTVSFVPASIRYLKLAPTQGPAVTGNWFSIGELSLYASVPQPMWTFTTSNSGSSAINAADGDIGSRWTSGIPVSPGVTYFTVDTHAMATIGAVRVNDSQYAGDLPSAGNVYTSTNGTSFSLVAQWTNANISGGILNVSWSPVASRFVKLVATQSPPVSTNWFSIGELTLYPTAP